MSDERTQSYDFGGLGFSVDEHQVLCNSECPLGEMGSASEKEYEIENRAEEGEER
jgi:hypothetical protein